MSLEKHRKSVQEPEFSAVLQYYGEAYDGDEVVEGTVLDMKPGEKGYAAYWSVIPDTAGRYWLQPLFKIEAEPFGRSVLITRGEDGFSADFSQRVVEYRDRFYDSKAEAGLIDRLMEGGSYYGFPLLEIAGDASQLPGFFCDENNEPPRPGAKGELYTRHQPDIQ